MNSSGLMSRCVGPSRHGVLSLSSTCPAAEMANATMGVTVVHLGGVRTAIATSARIPAGAPADKVARQQKAFKALLKLAPEDAAEQIAREA
jgi:hypothetical protein